MTETKKWIYDTTEIQGDSGGKTNILEGDCIGHCEKKKEVHMNKCLMLNGYRDKAP